MTEGIILCEHYLFHHPWIRDIISSLFLKYDLILEIQDLKLIYHHFNEMGGSTVRI